MNLVELFSNYNIIKKEWMAESISFSWDAGKNVINQNKHTVSFEEAVSVFYDEEAIVISDDEHSIDEDRFVIIGTSSKLRVLVVCHCYRKNDEEIRIISARKAKSRERMQYEESIKRRQQ